MGIVTQEGYNLSLRSAESLVDTCSLYCGYHFVAHISKDITTFTPLQITCNDQIPLFTLPYTHIYYKKCCLFKQKNIFRSATAEGKQTSQFNYKLLSFVKAELHFTTTDMQKTIQYGYCLQKQNLKIKGTE